MEIRILHFLIRLLDKIKLYHGIKQKYHYLAGEILLMRFFTRQSRFYQELFKVKAL